MKVGSLTTQGLKLAIALASIIYGSVTAQEPDRKDCHCNPDPHFKTWDDTYYDYHGGCSLVLVHVPNILDVHITTVPVTGFSFIEKVGLRVGTDELTLDKNTDGIGIPADLDGNPFTYNSSTGTYELSLPDGQYVRVTEWYGSMSVKVHGASSVFSDAVGMCGNWNVPGLVDRNGTSSITADEMGEEWKVIDPTDNPISGIGSSATCTPPTPHGASTWCKENGCLCDPDNLGDEPRCQCGGRGEGQEGVCECANDACVTMAEIETACENVTDPEQQENCKFDVRTTGDITWGEAPFYAGTEPPQPPFGKSKKDRGSKKSKAGSKSKADK